MDGLNFTDTGPLFWVGLLALAYLLWRLFFSQGRAETSDDLDRILAQMGEAYRVIKGATFIADKAMIRVDVLIVSAFGVFVITVVDYKGILKGRLSDREWILKRGSNETAIHNPLWINRKQANALESLLPATKIFSWVVVLNAQIKTETSKKILSLDAFEKEVAQYRKEVLSSEQQEEVFQIVSPKPENL
jgi:hypothetical protein